jgi:predicted phage terminase large subunit-like protein
MRPNLLHHAAHRAYGGFPVLQAIEDARRAEEAQLAATAEPYTASFRNYIATAYPRFPFTRHTLRLIDLAQRVADGDLPRLMVELPPRHWKSTIFSRFLPGYCMRRFPDRSGGICCQTQDLAVGFSEAARDYFVASGGALSPSRAGKEEWASAEGIGSIWTAGIGKGTGKPGHWLFIDDPIKGREEAESAAFRRQVHNWWDSVLSAREEPGNSVVVVHTRWHEADLIGYLLGKNLELEKEGLEDECERWHVVSLPIEAVAANDIKPLPATVTREPDNRQAGEALDPDRFNQRWIRRKRANTPERDWESIYQQRPSAGKGTVFFLDRMRFYGTTAWPGDPGDPLLPERFIRTILSVDCTFDDTAGSDMVAMTLWGQSEQGAWLLDLVNERLDFPATLAMIRSMHVRHRFGELVIEKKANGAAAIKMLTRESHGYRVVASGVGDMGSKESRANAASVEFNNGRVFLPRSAPWSNTVVQQLIKFPADTFDDIVDSTSQLLIYLTGHGPITFSTASWGHGAGGAGGGGATDPAELRRLGWSDQAIMAYQQGLIGR